MIVKVDDMSRNYIVWKRTKGFLGQIKSLLVQEYSIVEAVKNVSFSIEHGEMVGFIGSNGAGKSTTIKMLTGILSPSSGTVSALGFNPFKQRKQYVKNIGAVFGQRTQLWWDLPVLDSFDMLKHIYDIPLEVYRDNLKKFYEILDIGPFVNKPVRQLSLGQRVRADIAASLLHNPSIIFFDEPTIGLDITAKDNIRQFIKHINETRDVTILFTTHDMRDIEEVCKRIIIIDNGKLIYDDSISKLKNIGGVDRTLYLKLQLPHNIKEISLDNGIVEILSEDEISISFNKDETDVTKLVNYIAGNNKVLDITIEEIGIETIVRKIYSGKFITS